MNPLHNRSVRVIVREIETRRQLHAAGLTESRDDLVRASHQRQDAAAIAITPMTVERIFSSLT